MNFDWMQLANSNFQNMDRTTFGNMWSGYSSAVGSWMNQLLMKNLMPFEYSLQTRRHLTGAEREQNAFNAEQAQMQRDFTQNIFNQQVALENTAVQRQVQDMQKAGVNPALMYQSGSPGAGTPSAGSGAAASGSASGAPNLSGFFQLGLLGAQIQNLQAQAALSRANAGYVESKTEGQDIENRYADSYWQRQISIMDESKAQIIANTNKARQELATEEYRTAIANNQLDQSWCDAQIRMYEMFMTRLDYQSKDEILGLQIRAMELANEGKHSEIDAINEQIGEIVARKGLAMKQAGYFDALGRHEKAYADFFETDEGKQTIKDTAKGEAQQTAARGKYAKYGVWLEGVGGFVKDLGVGVGAALAVKRFKAKISASDVSSGLPKGATMDTPVILD